MASTGRTPRQSTRERRAFDDIGGDFIPYTGAIKDVDLGTFGLTTTGILDADGLTIGATGGGTITDIKDEDNLVSDSQTALATQQSIKAYVDATVLTQEEVEDYAGALVANATGTHTGIAITYQDATNDMDFIVDHDAATNFVANEHIDHTGITLTAGDGLTGGGTIAANRTFNADYTAIQAQGDVLDDLNTLGIVANNGEFLVGTAAGAFAWESGSTVRDSLELGTGHSVTFNIITAGSQIIVADNFYTATRSLKNSDAQTTVDWQGSQLYDTAGDLSIHAQDRQLIADGGVDVILDWNTAGAANFSDTNLATTGTINLLTLISVATGFTIAGGTTPKTLTVDDDFVASTQLAAIAANTAKTTESTTVTAPLVLTTYDVSIPVAATAADGYLSSTNWNTFNDKADYSFGANNFSGTGSGTFGKLVVATTNLVVNPTGYAGNVGIGTATPVETLSITSVGNTQMSMNSPSASVPAMYFKHDAITRAAMDIEATTHDFRIYITPDAISWYEGLRIKNSNRYVGVNTSSPDTRLQVVGDCKFGDDNTNYALFSTTGDLSFVGTAGLPYGEIYYHGAGFDTILAAQDTWYQILGFDTNGLSNNTTPDHTNDHITITKAGVYDISYRVSCRSAASNQYEFAIYKNNGVTYLTNTCTHRDTTVAAKLGVLAVTAKCSCAVNDTIELWVQRIDGGAVAKTITIESVTFGVTQIGGI